jgi:hypothetical protein
MTKEKDMDIKEALRNEKKFLKFLRHKADKNNSTIEDTAKTGPHPTAKMLYAYVLGWTSEEENEAIMKHIASCDICLEEVMRIRGIENELHHDMLKWADSQGLFERLKHITSKRSFSAWALTFDLVRGGTQPKKREQTLQRYATGDRIVFCLEIPADGHLAVFHYDAGGRVQCVFPQSFDESTFVSGGSEKRIVGRITEPLGKQTFKAIWTTRQLLYPQKIDFSNTQEIERTMNTFFDSLLALHKTEWRETTYEFEVIKE